MNVGTSRPVPSERDTHRPMNCQHAVIVVRGEAKSAVGLKMGVSWEKTQKSQIYLASYPVNVFVCVSDFRGQLIAIKISFFMSNCCVECGAPCENTYETVKSSYRLLSCVESHSFTLSHLSCHVCTHRKNAKVLCQTSTWNIKARSCLWIWLS